jgi:uncharacterized membrane protein YhaH (DUF805 family)
MTRDTPPSTRRKHRRRRYYYDYSHGRRKRLQFWLGTSIFLAFLVLIAGLGIALHDELEKGLEIAMGQRGSASNFDPPPGGPEPLKVISGCAAILSLMYLVLAVPVWTRSR